ncbi:hypothetical protein [Olivibacter sitiensis]|uniref:hypothetical protein n=1 Tax=Olivibacter sitiensis TaxID=376470 RepID=UPI0004884814|nr:hypothetical protein [Olivibacter sitiensis]
MKIPEEIAPIITRSGNTELTISEKRKLLDWYRKLDTGSNAQLFDKEVSVIEKRILKSIMNHISRHGL